MTVSTIEQPVPCDPPTNAAAGGRKPGNRALRRGRVSLPHHAYLVTAATLGRRRAFADFWAACAVSQCCVDPRLHGDAQVLAWVLMPDHAHWLLQLGARDSLERVVNRLKSASARAANGVLGGRGPLWQPAYHDHAVRADEDLRVLARYVVANPLRAGLVTRVGDYPFWGAAWL